MQTLSDKQKEAINRSCDVRHSIVPVTGIAGTGKTTIMKMIAEKCRAAGYVVELAAPTGKAAKRITEATGLPARTLHRLLEYPHPDDVVVVENKDNNTDDVPPNVTEPRRNKDNPIDADVILVDEYPMVPFEVHRNLINAMRRGAVLRVFGDVRQLKPIESDARRRKEPSSFEALLTEFDGIVLDRNYRQEAGSGIAENGELIVKGRAPRSKSDFELVVTEQPIVKLERVVERLTRDGFRFTGLDAQIVTCTNGTWIGTNKLNGLLQTMLHPDDGHWVMLPRNKWSKAAPIAVRKGDKVVWTKNNYDLAIFNGETGIIVDIDDSGEITIDFSDRIVSVPPVLVARRKDGTEYDYDPRTAIDLGYCVTTHKAQGSEFKAVVYVLNKSTRGLQCRANFYTAVTRARQHVVVITDQASLAQSLRPVCLMDMKTG